MSQITPALRKAFRNLADIMIPGTDTMPRGSDVTLHEDVLDRIMELRPDLEEGFVRGMTAIAGMSAAEGKEHLKQNDKTAYYDIGLIAASGYYMDPRVREAIGYPGQVSNPKKPAPVPEYIANGMLKRVIDRGSIYRPTPDTD